MNCLETFCIHIDQNQGKLIKEQHFGELSPLYGIMYDVQLQHACVCRAFIFNIKGPHQTTNSVRCVHLNGTHHSSNFMGVYTILNQLCFVLLSFSIILR
jgi:hypothetical protein